MSSFQKKNSQLYTLLMNQLPSMAFSQMVLFVTQELAKPFMLRLKDRMVGSRVSHVPQVEVTHMKDYANTFTPGLLNKLRTTGKISAPNLPFWIVFQGDITRDPCRVREITYWFNDFKSNYFFWRNTTKAEDLIDHFETYIAPLLED